MVFGPQLQLAKPPETQTAVAVPKTPPAPPKPAEDACEDGLLVSVAVGKKPCIKPGSGESFKDCPDCPEMVMAPAGSFSMGSPESEPERYSDEGPHQVTICEAFRGWPVCGDVRGVGGFRGGWRPCGGYRPEDQWLGRDGTGPLSTSSWR